MIISLALGLVLASGCPASRPVSSPTPPTPVVTPAPPVTPVTTPASPTDVPKLRLPKTFAPTSYAATLAIDPAKTTFEASVEISGNLSERSAVIWLHGRGLMIKRATARHEQTSLTLAVTPHGEDLLEVRAEQALDPGAWVLAFDYTGGFAELETAGAFRQVVAGKPYVMTQLEALFARRVFPCVDEPDSKVPWQLTLDVPNGNIAVGNTLPRESTLPDGRHRFEFARTLPLPAYLIAFGVGPFAIVDAGKSKRGVPVRIVTLDGRAADAAYAAQTTARVLDLEEDWFGIPYPYGKLDIVTIPITVGFGAMENAGMITMSEELMLLDKPGWKRRRTFISVIAHEIAHQWFGDYVTTAWWDDIWLNEGFASWIGPKITTKFEPAWHEELAELDTRMSALEADSLVSARRVRQQIEIVDDIHNAFDGITYSKGASVLEMFEVYVGPEPFQRGVRKYLESRAHGNATSTDFVTAIQAAGGKDVIAAFSSFLDQPGAPEIVGTTVCDKAGARVELTQQRYVATGSPDATADKPWIVPVCAVYEQRGKRAESCTLLAAETGTLALPQKSCPRWVMLNAKGRGHYRARYSIAQATALRDEAWAQLSWTERRAVFFDVSQSSRNKPKTLRTRPTKPPSGKLPLALVLSLVPRMLAGGDRFTVGDALNTPWGLDRLVADDQRAKFEGWVRATFGPGATKVGVLPKPNDDLDAEQNRALLFDLVAWTGRDPELVKQAVDLAASWRDLPESMRGTMLTVAVDASPDLHAKLIRDVKTERDRVRRDEMFHALAAVRDAKRVEAALELLLDPSVDFRESSTMLSSTSSEATRKVAERFVRAHEKALVDRMPKDAVTGVASLLVGLFTSGCDAGTRDEVTAYVTQHYGTLAGGKRVIDQNVEALDQCISTRALIGPELKAFLSGVKLPKPKAP